MSEKNLWILTEERPKKQVIEKILYKFSKDHQVTIRIDTLKILPHLEKNRKFSSLYEVVGFDSKKVNKVFLKMVSGKSSFVDFLVFHKDDQPEQSDVPLYIIEETKTSDSESRNTGVYQRCSKFVYANFFYPDVPKIMFYNLSISQQDPTKTYIFGTRCLITLGVEIMGKELDSEIFTPFSNIDELIAFKEEMDDPPAGNVPITIKKDEDVIKVSGRLYKSGYLAHDPNIGALSLICATLRKLGWEKKIVITRHGLEQSNLTSRNKFILIANGLDIELEGLDIPSPSSNKKYWKYETKGEKLGSVFIHVLVENFTSGKMIFENHGGCEKGYFITKDGPVALKKYTDREAYKNGDKSKIVNIPDLILMDSKRKEIINIEGKKYKYRHKAIEELKNFDAIEDIYIKKHYPDFDIIRTVVLTGGSATKIKENKVGFLLNQNGDLVLGENSPAIFNEAIENLFEFWS